jgi:hypothetical protein
MRRPINDAAYFWLGLALLAGLAILVLLVATGYVS